jgi:hypothetical protein
MMTMMMMMSPKYQHWILLYSRPLFCQLGFLFLSSCRAVGPIRDDDDDDVGVEDDAGSGKKVPLYV